MAWQDRQKEWKNLQTVQARLGEISMIWSALDRSLDAILTDMLDIGPAQTAAIVTGMLPKKKCEILSRLLLIAAPSKAWSTDLSAAMVAIDKLGDERNRLIHDPWRFGNEGITRIDPRAQIKKAQSREEKSLVFDVEHPVTMDDLQAWCTRGYEIIRKLDELRPALLPWLLQEREKLSH